ncbi:MAG: helix-turn-helix domain-containing protein [Clostridia bacterium]|nr:helix-turn-helix domain-containing protein [Clostridia bacterium]
MSPDKKTENKSKGYMNDDNVNSLGEDIILYGKVPDNDVIIVPVMAGITNPDPDYFVRRTTSTRLQLAYVLEYVISGKGYIDIEGKKYTLKAGDFFLQNRYTKAYYYSDKDDPFKKIWITLYGSFMSGLATTYNINEPLLLVRADKAGDYILKLHEIVEESNKIGFEQCSDKFMIELLKLFQYIEKIRKSEYLLRGTVDFQQLSVCIIRHINDEYLSVEYLVNRFNISYTTLYRICMKNAKMSPQHYIEVMKLNRAKDMLLANSLTVSDIAERLNFSSTGYFCKVFKKNEGCSATEWRKRALSADKKRQPLY